MADEEHVHEYELLLKDRYIALFFCECGAAKSAPVDEQGRIHFWNSTSAPKPRLEDADAKARRSNNGN